MLYLICSLAALSSLAMFLASLTLYLKQRKLKKLPLDQLGAGAQIIKDFRTHGYSIVRIDPDDIMLRR